MNKKLFIFTIILLSVFSLFFLIPSHKIKGDETYNNPLLPDTPITLNYDYLLYISENKSSNIDYYYIWNYVIFDNSYQYEIVELYINKQVYSSNYIEMYFVLPNENEVLSLFKYSDALGDYVLNFYDDNFNITSSIPLSELNQTLLYSRILFYTNADILDTSLMPYIYFSMYFNTTLTFFENLGNFNLYDYNYFLSGVLLYPIEYNGVYYSTFNAINIYNNKITFVFTFGNQEISILVYDNGWLYDNARYLRVYNSYINRNLFEWLSLTSVFANTYQVPTSDMKDLIFAYADIPYKITKSLTSFEIMGYTLFAILGTIILFMLVIKVIKR